MTSLAHGSPVLAAHGSPVLAALDSRGFVIEPLAAAWQTTPEGLRDLAASSPFAFAARVLGVPPLLVERQPIRPLPDGRSFASSRIDTPLHTDSQMFLGMPATAQILVCIEAAEEGGESVLVDGARVLERLVHEAPALATALFDVERVQRFYFGDVVGPTIARRGGHLTWTLAPPQGVTDAVGRDLGAALAQETSIVHTLAPGEALVASNHRMLHGRRPFSGSRELVRLLVWLERPLGADPEQLARSRELGPSYDAATFHRLRAVLAILRGAPPAKTAADAGVDEATLYGWRDAFAREGIGALARVMRR